LGGLTKLELPDLCGHDWRFGVWDVHGLWRLDGQQRLKAVAVRGVSDPALSGFADAQNAIS
jgi:hypothetical protein